VALTAVVRGGTVHDGTGAPGVAVDVGIERDRVVVVGTDLPDSPGAREIDATGLAVTPGFINVLSHAWGSLQVDGSGASDLLQGVTTEVFGEAISLGPGNDLPLGLLGARPGTRIAFDRLGEGLDHLVSLGIAPNVASFVGGANLRLLGAGYDDRPLTPAELDRLVGLVGEEMSDGALGIGTALIYPPESFSSTPELAALCRVLGRHGGTYVSHLRSEGDRFLECLEELIGLGRDGGCRAEVYHLKAAGRHNWHKMQQAIDRIEQAQADGQPIGANMYPYTAGGTALMSSIPPQFHAGGPAALLARLADADVRRQVVAALHAHSDTFENLFLAASEGAGVLLGDDAAGLPTRGRNLVEIAADRGLSDPAEALIEIVRAAPETEVLYFVADEANVELGLSQPWVSIGSDAEAHDLVEPFVSAGTHPRTYGSFARFLGHYARDRGLAAFPDAVRRLTSMPADRFGLAGRGRLAPGAFADVVVLDPAAVRDQATYLEPHRHSEGVVHVLVNGSVVVQDGALTPARPGRRLRRGVA
jgi:N-acyl-D-amino-acid deacylase